MTLTVVRSLSARVQPRPLLVVLAAVFAGLSVVLVVAAAVTATPLVLLAAVPLAVTALMMWYQGTGRLAGRLVGGTRRRRRRRTTRAAVGTASDARDRVTERGHRGSGGTTVREEAAREARSRARRQARRRAGGRARGGGVRGGGDARDGADARRDTDAGDASSAWRDRRERADRLDGLTRAEAYDVLGLDPTAGDDAVRDAYREKAKTAHPDTEGGSAESFQRLNDAYERLIDG